MLKREIFLYAGIGRYAEGLVKITKTLSVWAVMVTPPGEGKIKRD